MKVLTVWEKDPLTGWEMKKSCDIVGKSFNTIEELVGYLLGEYDALEPTFYTFRDSKAEEMDDYWWLDLKFITKYQKRNPQVNQARKTVRIMYVIEAVKKV